MRQIGEGSPEAVPGADIKLVPSTGTLEVIWTDLDKTNLLGELFIFSIQEVDSEGLALDLPNYSGAVMGLSALNTYMIPKTDVTASKVWVGGPDVHPTIHFQLMRQIGDGSPEAVPGAAILELLNGTTEVEWTDLDVTNMDGQHYTFSVREVNAEGVATVPENYEMSADGLVITNTFKSRLRDVEMKKVWVGLDVNKVDIQIQLFANGVALGEPILLRAGQTGILWKDLPELDDEGMAIRYTVDEVETPPMFVKSISEDGLTITNTAIPTPLPQTGTREDSGKAYAGLLLAGGLALWILSRRRRREMDTE